MKKASIIAAILLGLPFISETHAEQNTIRLICKYSHTRDEKGERSATSGESFITVSFSNDGNAIITKQGLGAKFTGKVSDEEMYGTTEYEIYNLTHQETLTINRYTGAFVSIFNIANGSKGGLVHYGTCEQATKKLF